MDNMEKNIEKKIDLVEKNIENKVASLDSKMDKIIQLLESDQEWNWILKLPNYTQDILIKSIRRLYFFWEHTKQIRVKKLYFLQTLHIFIFLDLSFFSS